MPHSWRPLSRVRDAPAYQPEAPARGEPTNARWRVGLVSAFYKRENPSAHLSSSALLYLDVINRASPAPIGSHSMHVLEKFRLVASMSDKEERTHGRWAAQTPGWPHLFMRP